MMNEQTQQALRAVYTHASWIDAEMNESTLAEVRAAMMQCKTPTAYDKVYKVRGPPPPSPHRSASFQKGRIDRRSRHPPMLGHVAEPDPNPPPSSHTGRVHV